MSSIEVRPFQRTDRDQLTALVNAHAAAVTPGVRVSVNAVLSQLEREPGEFIVDPWVERRSTLVAEQRGRISAAAHLLRYGAGGDVRESYRDVGEIRWFVFWPPAPFWPDAPAAAEALIAACFDQFNRWSVSRQYADGALPAPGVYGVPDQWPHVQAAYEAAGFVHGGRIETVYIAAVADLARPGLDTPGDAVLRRSLGINGTRLSAFVDDELLGYIELETLEDGGRLAQHRGLADIGNLRVADEHRGRGIDSWLLAQAGDWLGLAGVDRLLAYSEPGADDWMSFLAAAGFRVLTETRRGWERQA